MFGICCPGQAFHCPVTTQPAQDLCAGNCDTMQIFRDSSTRTACFCHSDCTTLDACCTGYDAVCGEPETTTPTTAPAFDTMCTGECDSDVAILSADVDGGFCSCGPGCGELDICCPGRSDVCETGTNGAGADAGNLLVGVEASPAPPSDDASALAPNIPAIAAVAGSVCLLMLAAVAYAVRRRRDGQSTAVTS